MTDSRIEELRRNPIFRKLLKDLDALTLEQIARLDRDILDGTLTKEEAENDETKEDPA